jgi:hypothetical protein
MTLGLVITCHPAYLPRLPDCLDAWELQFPYLDQRVLVLDNVDDQALQSLVNHYPSWNIVRGYWSNPNPARNAGWLACSTDWIIGWDADNVPPPTFAQAARRHAAVVSSDVGALAPDYIDPIKQRTLNHAASRYADPREHFICDTASVWRREAVLMAGGWLDNQQGHDDWSLAKNIHNQGWKIEPLPNLKITLTPHGSRRSLTKPVNDCLWLARSVGVVTLQAGRISLVERWLECLAQQDMPPHWGLTIMLPANRAGLRHQFQSTVEQLCEQWANPPCRVTILTPSRSAMQTPLTESPEAAFFNTHRTVANLYAQAIAATPEDLILTWEDDVFPHSTTALRCLSDQIHPASRTAACAAVYPSRGNPRHAVAAAVVGEWAAVPTLVSLPQRPVPMANVGFGFTLWQRPALEQCPILAGSRSTRNYRLGLDGDLCRRLHAAEWKIKLHGAVTCDHVTQL